MRTTISLDDDLFAAAQAYTAMAERSALGHEALTLLIVCTTVCRLGRPGGLEPDLRASPRRRPKAASYSLPDSHRHFRLGRPLPRT